MVQPVGCTTAKHWQSSAAPSTSSISLKGICRVVCTSVWPGAVRYTTSARISPLSTAFPETSFTSFTAPVHWVLSTISGGASNAMLSSAVISFSCDPTVLLPVSDVVRCWMPPPASAVITSPCASATASMDRANAPRTSTRRWLTARQFTYSVSPETSTVAGPQLPGFTSTCFVNGSFCSA